MTSNLYGLLAVFVTCSSFPAAAPAQAYGPGNGMGVGMRGGMGQMQVSQGNPVAGKGIATQVCAACHGADGNSIQAAFPRLAGQKESYLYSQLLNFASGARQNELMAGIVSGLSERNKQDVAAYFSRQVSNVNPVSPNTRVSQIGQRLFMQGDPARQIPACANCHAEGAPMARRANPPLLDGLRAEYIETQLHALKNGTRTQAMMMPMIASRLTDADIKAVATYLGNAP